jgi:hypothetical protein
MGIVPQNIIATLSTPGLVQEYLNNKIAYNPKDTFRSLHGILKTGEADCFEGSVSFAYILLSKWGYDPRIVIMQAIKDVDHLITVYKQEGRYGSVAMSSQESLKDRPPIYPTIHDLVVSYYPYYTSIYPEYKGQKTMIGYSDPINLIERFGTNWFMLPGDNALEYLYDHITDNVYCTNLHTFNRYPYPPE